MFLGINLSYQHLRDLDQNLRDGSILKKKTNRLFCHWKSELNTAITKVNVQKIFNQLLLIQPTTNAK